MSFPMLSPTRGQIPTYYSPVRHSHQAEARIPFDLHVLSMPPAFNLSQDQTLQFKKLFTSTDAKPSEHEPSPSNSKLLGLKVLVSNIMRIAHDANTSPHTNCSIPSVKELSPTRSVQRGAHYTRRFTSRKPCNTPPFTPRRSFGPTPSPLLRGRAV